MIAPTPVSMGWPELAFASLAACSGIAALWQQRAAIPPRALWIALGITVLLLINLLVARHHDVPVGDWLRGLIPFLFLLYAVPVWLIARAEAAFSPTWKLAALISAALFGGRVVAVYVLGHMWEPTHYLYQDGNWIPLAPEQVAAAGERVHFFFLRVTLVLQQSTDVLLPLGIAWGVWTVLWAKGRGTRYLGLALAVTATIAVVLTYTRSMLLAAGAVVGVLLLAAMARGHLLRATVVGVVLGATVAVTIAGFGLGPIYLNRLYQFDKQMEQMAQMAQGGGLFGSGAAGAVEAPADANISSRLEEYLIAWDMFRQSPVLGQGLGIKHDIRFDAGHGRVLEQRVGYVHNWVMYMLMTGGLVGLAAYLVVLFGPTVLAWQRGLSQAQQGMVLTTLACMAVYGLFFAVFRLIPFNLVLGGVWGLVLAAQPARAEH